MQMIMVKKEYRFLDYENEVERMLSMIDIENIKKVLQSTGESPLKIKHVFILKKWHRWGCLVSKKVYKFILAQTCELLTKHVINSKIINIL